MKKTVKEKPGVLIIPSNTNGDTLLNVLSLVLDKKIREQERFPTIKKITFLETDDTGKSDQKIRLKDEYFSQADAYIKMLNILGHKGMEIRIKELDDYTKDIPEIIMSAVTETGNQDLIILDLTNGTKEITGTLYTAGTICGIERMIYVQVKRDKQGKFYTLNEEDDKTNLYELKTFKAMDNLQTLASMNGMEFIMYKKKIDALRNEKESEFWGDLCTRLDNAVDYYFDSNKNGIPQAIQNIGIINEHIIKDVLKCFGPIWKKYNNENRKIKYDDLRLSHNWYYQEEQYIREGKSSKTKIEKYNAYGELFRYIPNLYHFIDMERVYRNMVSHGLKSELKKEDAKTAITIMFRMIDGLLESPLSKEMFADE